MKIGYVTQKHQYNTWQQMKTQGHICRKLTGTIIYLYRGRFLEVSQAPPVRVPCCKFINNSTSDSPVPKHAHAHRHTGFCFPLQDGGKAGTETQRVSLTANPNTIKSPHRIPDLSSLGPAPIPTSLPSCSSSESSQVGLITSSKADRRSRSCQLAQPRNGEWPGINFRSDHHCCVLLPFSCFLVLCCLQERTRFKPGLFALF